jgi:hypothetical protein
MTDLLPAAVTVAMFAVAIGGMLWLAGRVRRTGMGGSVLGPFQDMYDPAAYRSQIEIQVLTDRKAPSSSPGDPPWLANLDA